MDNVTYLLWEAVDCPSGDGTMEGVCRICGNEAIGLLFEDWVRPTFTDFDKILPGGIICHACQFSFCERSELLMQMVGKDKPQRMRNYSHFVVGKSWLPLSKGDKARMRDILLHDNPIVAVVAESGQKHIIFRATPGMVQFEEQRLCDISGLESLLNIVEELYIGFSKKNIMEGRYAQYRIRDFGIERWLQLERQLKSLRQTVLFSLAVFLAQKEEEKDDNRVTRRGGEVAGGDLEGHTGWLQESLQGFDMGSV